MNLATLIEPLLAPLRRRLALLVTRAVVRAVKDSTKVQEVVVSMLRNELQSAQHLQEYGYASHPLPASGTEGPEGLAFSVGGDRSHLVVLCVGDRRYRLKSLAPGEVAIYDDQGAKVHLTRAGIVVDGGGRVVTFQNAPSVEVEADLHVTGELLVDGNATVQGEVSDANVTTPTMSSIRAIFNSHQHSGGGNPPIPPLM